MTRRREPWLDDGLLAAARKAKQPPALEIVFTFKDGPVRTIQTTLKPDEHNFWVYREGEDASRS